MVAESSPAISGGHPDYDDRPTVIDLFSGCGGMSLGFVNAGFRVLLAADLDSVANGEYEANLHIKPHQLDLFETTAHDILSLAGISRGELDVLVGCPPCQGFTSLRSRERTYSTNDLVPKMAELGICILPKFIIFENVRGILSWGWEYFSDYLHILAEAGYSTVYGNLQAADYGVPQLRKRMIAISTRSDLSGAEFWLPTPTHARPNLVANSGRPPWRTVRDAIADLPPLGRGEVNLDDPTHRVSYHGDKVLNILRSIPRDGGNRRDLPDNLWLKCHKKLGGGAENVYGRMAWDRPGPTVSSRCNVPACGRFTHPEQDRGMSIREALRLQTFPDSYSFTVGITPAAKLIGNAMPVLFARRVAEHIKRMLQTAEKTAN